MSTTSYVTVKLNESGETYAAEITPEGRILRAAGPLHYNDPRDADSLCDLIDNEFDTEVLAADLEDTPGYFIPAAQKKSA